MHRGRRGYEHYYMATLIFKTSNNEAKYEFLITRLSIAKTLGAMEIEAKADSQILVNQVIGVYTTKREKMEKISEPNVGDLQPTCLF